MSKKHKKVYTALNYTEHQLSLIFTVRGCVSMSGFALAGIHIGITSSEIELKICVITAGIKKYKSIIKKKKKKHDRIILLAKSKLNSIEILISKALIDFSISYDEFVLINDVLKEYDYMKEETKSTNDKYLNINFNYKCLKYI